MHVVAFNSVYHAALLAHFERHWVESGVDGNHFMPFDIAQAARPRGIDLAACDLPFDQTGWQRWLVLWDGSQVIGHAGLNSHRMLAAPHRCELGMGIEAPYRGRGFGHQLVRAAVSIAASIPGMRWLDLRVMGENHTARALYTKHGFTEHGMVKDAFRIQGQSIDEVMMSLDLQRIREA